MDNAGCGIVVKFGTNVESIAHRNVITHFRYRQLFTFTIAFFMDKKGFGWSEKSQWAEKLTSNGSYFFGQNRTWYGIGYKANWLGKHFYSSV